MNTVDKGVRATNWIIDIPIVYIIWIAISYLFGYYDLSIYIIMFFYYLLMELFFGQTVGKIITKTKVVKNDGSKPNFINIFLRTFWRIVPIDTMSYLFGYERGMHDIYSSTSLKKMN